MMDQSEVIGIFRRAGAVLEGHFILSSGLRSPVFLQKARVFMHADLTEALCRALAEKIRAEVPGSIDFVVGPAVGGIIPAYETSRHLGVPAIWVEREGGQFRLRRFELEPGARVVVVEDIVTTGLSIRETIVCLEELGAEVLAAACIIDPFDGCETSTMMPHRFISAMTCLPSSLSPLPCAHCPLASPVFESES